MNTEHIVIRPFDAASDVDALSKLWFEASLMAHPFLGRARLIEQRKLIEGTYLPQSETWVACRAGKPVGFISLLDLFIGGLFVAPDQQGQGIGRQLIDHVLSLKAVLTLEVYTLNHQAMRFYSALGFKEVSRRAFDDEGCPFETARLRLSA